MKQSALKPARKKACKVCKEKFTPPNTLTRTCSIKCAIADGKETQKKEYKAITRKARKKLNDNDRSYWLDKAQTACNAYIRERDKHLPCISCGTTNPNIQYCAGHFKTRGGHPELRFHPMNIHKQCNKYCNMSLSGNIAEYRPRLIEKIGLSAVEWLEGAHKPQKPSIEDLREITEYYKDLRRLLISND